jgi:ABC-type bacteriocin/lantibiotic exporter with double-glycine peptidase domain
VLELAPLELQRRVVKAAVDQQKFTVIALLCLLYVLVELIHGGLKLFMNVYQASVSESASQRLRLETNLIPHVPSEKGDGPKDEGIAISIIVSEVDAVGGFIGASFSGPLLNGGILLSVFGYMIFIQPLMALVAFLVFCPQVLFIPLLQRAINRRTKLRIETLRALSVAIVDEAAERTTRKEETYRHRVRDIYQLNMQIFRRKFSMNFLMNLLHHLGIIGILTVSGWLLLHGETEVGTVVAFISGLNRMNDPWGDLVNYFRDVTNAGVKFELIKQALHKGSTVSVESPT